MSSTFFFFLPNFKNIIWDLGGFFRFLNSRLPSSLYHPVAQYLQNSMGNSTSIPPAFHRFTPTELELLKQSYSSPLPSILPLELISILKTESLEEWVQLAHVITTHAIHSDLFNSRFSNIPPSSLLLHLVVYFQDLLHWERSDRFLAYLTNKIGEDISLWFNKSHILFKLWDVVFNSIFFPPLIDLVIPSTTRESKLLTNHDILVLNSSIPIDDRTGEWTRVFSSEEDGNAFSPFKIALEQGGSTVIVIRDKKGIHSFK
jgi:hypothetical protein